MQSDSAVHFGKYPTIRHSVVNLKFLLPDESDDFEAFSNLKKSAFNSYHTVLFDTVLHGKKRHKIVGLFTPSSIAQTA